MNYLNLIPIILLAVIIITLLIENKKLKNSIKAKDEAYEVAMKTIKQYQNKTYEFNTSDIAECIRKEHQRQSIY